nr:cysteine--tRNA ligase [Sphaerochaetaceae bacterium]
RALSVLWGLVKDDDVPSDEKLTAIAYMDEVLGLKLLDAPKTEEDAVPAEVVELVEKRVQAKKEKNWALADSLRAEVENLGYTVKDTPQGPQIIKK